MELYEVDLKKVSFHRCYLTATFICYEFGFGLLLVIFWNDSTRTRKDYYVLATYGIPIVAYSFMNTINHFMLICQPVQGVGNNGY